MAADEVDKLRAQLEKYVGKPMGPPSVAPDPVNVPMIRHWVDALELQFDRLTGFGQQFDGVKLQARRGDVAWFADIDSAQLVGDVVDFFERIKGIDQSHQVLARVQVSDGENIISFYSALRFDTIENFWITSF